MKKVTSAIALMFALTLFGSHSTFADSASSNDSIEESANVGRNLLESMLEQQESLFEKGTPLANNSVSKLTETDEAVLLYYALSKVDKLSFHDFNYDVQDVEVYEENGKSYVEGYVVRTFVFGDEKEETGLGDYIKFEINASVNQLSSEANISLKDVSVVSNTATEHAEDITLEKFLENYQAEQKEDESIPDTSEDEDVEENQLSYKYSGSAAATYARKYATSPNKSYKYWKEADCTNFVSQALKAGGITNFTKWKPYTDAWINAGAFRNYIREKGGILMSTVKDNYSNAYLGDTYHYDTRGKFGGKPDGWMEHTAVVTSLHSSKIWVSYHTNNRLNVPREYYTAKEGGKRYLSDIK